MDKNSYIMIKKMNKKEKERKRRFSKLNNNTIQHTHNEKKRKMRERVISNISKYIFDGSSYYLFAIE